MTRIVIFPDTNVFLQCRALQELPWAEALEADEIRLLIGAPVRDEIDRLKQDGNTRRAKRARDANSLFRQILRSTEGSVAIREASPRIEVRFAPRLRVDRETPAGLDLKRADERLIDEVLECRKSDATARILSDDTGLQLAARDYDLPVVAVPEDWKLLPESDERDKKILELQAQLTALQATEPVPVLALTDEHGEEIDAGVRRLPRYLELSEEEASHLTDAVKQRHPQVPDPDTVPAPEPTSDPQNLLEHIGRMTQQFAAWSAPTTEQFAEYGNEYKKWLSTVKKTFRRLAFPLNTKGRLIPLDLKLSNPGSRDASDTLVELRVIGDVRLFASGSDEVPELLEQVLKLPYGAVIPKPPAPPTTRMLGYFAGKHTTEGVGLWDPNLLVPPVPRFKSPLHRDRHIFYRREESDAPAVEASFTCDEFRHGREPEVFRLWLVVLPDPALIRAHLSVRVSASNLSRAIELHQDFTFESEVQSTLAVAENWRVE